MKDKLYIRSRKEVFEDCNIKNSDKRYNCHHIQFKRDINKLPKDFTLSKRSNLIPLPIDIHEELHELIDQDTYFKNNLQTRVYLANMAFSGDLQDIPDHIYFTKLKR